VTAKKTSGKAQDSLQAKFWKKHRQWLAAQIEWNSQQIKFYQEQRARFKQMLKEANKS